MKKNSLNREVSGSHYQQYKIQPIELIAALGWDFFQGNIAKYTLRAKYKNGQQDIDKAVHYCELAMDLNPKTNGWIDSGEIDNFIKKNNLPGYWQAFLAAIDDKQYKFLKQTLSDNQIVEKYFL